MTCPHCEKENMCRPVQEIWKEDHIHVSYKCLWCGSKFGKRWERYDSKDNLMKEVENE